MENKKNVLMLIGDVHKLFHRHIRKEAEAISLCECYRPIIFALAHHDGLSQLDLVNFTRYKAPTISLTLQKMEVEGYVERKTSPDDARKTLVYITDKGREYDKQMIEIFKKSENDILSKFTEDELKGLESTLRKLINTMCQEFGEHKNENI